MNKILILISFSFLFGITSIAQNRMTSYDFPIKPGSAKWQAFKSVEEMYTACQIPQDILAKISTSALIQTCLDYPASAVLLIHNTPQQGFDDWKQHFNGIQDLLTRSDVKEELLKVYSNFDTKGHAILKSDTEKGHYTFILSMLESIIVQDEITGNLSAKLQKALLKDCLEKYRNMEIDEVYGFSSITSTGRIISKLAAVLGNEMLKTQIEIPDVQEFINTGFLKDRQILLDIISSAQKINTNE